MFSPLNYLEVNYFLRKYGNKIAVTTATSIAVIISDNIVSPPFLCKKFGLFTLHLVREKPKVLHRTFNIQFSRYSSFGIVPLAVILSYHTFVWLSTTFCDFSDCFEKVWKLRTFRKTHLILLLVLSYHNILWLSRTFFIFVSFLICCIYLITFLSDCQLLFWKIYDNIFRTNIRL